MADEMNLSAEGKTRRIPDSSLSKVRYRAIEEQILECLRDNNGQDAETVHAEVMKILRAVMRFDPDASRYTKEDGKRMVAYQKERRMKNKIAKAVELLKKVEID